MAGRRGVAWRGGWLRGVVKGVAWRGEGGCVAGRRGVAWRGEGGCVAGRRKGVVWRGERGGGGGV